jgi:nucleotide-binding universal stress UspA family protein
MVSHILVGVDGSDDSRRAALYATDLARQTGAKLTLLVVVIPPTATTFAAFDLVSMTATQPDAEHLARAQALIDSVIADLGHGRAIPSVVTGIPRDAIPAEAAKVGADLIVVGASGAGAVERLLLGSVSESVVRNADRPVLVVR